jgi:hypothetical protein
MCAIDAGTHISSVAVPKVHAETEFRLVWCVSRTYLQIEKKPTANTHTVTGYYRAVGPPRFELLVRRNADERPGQSAEVASVTALAEHADLPEKCGTS